MEDKQESLSSPRFEDQGGGHTGRQVRSLLTSDDCFSGAWGSSLATWPEDWLAPVAGYRPSRPEITKNRFSDGLFCKGTCGTFRCITLSNRRRQQQTSPKRQTGQESTKQEVDVQAGNSIAWCAILVVPARRESKSVCVCGCACVCDRGWFYLLSTQHCATND